MRNFRKEATKIPNMPFQTDYKLFHDMLDEIDILRTGKSEDVK